MQITGIICEYNPLHLGHQKQIDLVRGKNGADGGIVCPPHSMAKVLAIIQKTLATTEVME